MEYGILSIRTPLCDTVPEKTLLWDTRGPSSQPLPETLHKSPRYAYDPWEEHQIGRSVEHRAPTLLRGRLIE